MTEYAYYDELMRQQENDLRGLNIANQNKPKANSNGNNGIPSELIKKFASKAGASSAASSNSVAPLTAAEVSSMPSGVAALQASEIAGAGTSIGAGSGAGAGAGSGAGSSALAGASPFAALAAVIVGNEYNAKKGGHRREGSDYIKDVLGGKVLEQDMNGRWAKKIGGVDDKFGVGGDMKALGEFSTLDFSNGFRAMKNGMTGKFLKKIF